MNTMNYLQGKQMQPNTKASRSDNCQSRLYQLFTQQDRDNVTPAKQTHRWWAQQMWQHSLTVCFWGWQRNILSLKFFQRANTGCPDWTVSPATNVASHRQFLRRESSQSSAEGQSGENFCPVICAIRYFLVWKSWFHRKSKTKSNTMCDQRNI